MKVQRSISLKERIERKLYEKWALALITYISLYPQMRCFSWASNSSDQVFVKQLRRAKIIRKYFHERIYSLWSAARFLLATVSWFIDSLKLEMVVDGTLLILGSSLPGEGRMKPVICNLRSTVTKVYIRAARRFPMIPRTRQRWSDYVIHGS